VGHLRFDHIGLVCSLMIVVFSLFSSPISATKICADTLNGARVTAPIVTNRVATVAARNHKRLMREIDAYFKYKIGMPGHFREQRDLSWYLREMNVAAEGGGPCFSLIVSLKKLGSQSHILDLGAGEFFFIRDYLNNPWTQLLTRADACLSRGQNEPIEIENLRDLAVNLKANGPPNLTGITLSKGNLKKQLKVNPKVNFLTDIYFEDLPVSKITEKFGPVDLAIDFYGVFGYTLNLGITTEKVAQVMKEGAELWLRDDYADIKIPGVRRPVTTAEFLVTTGLFEPVSDVRRKRSNEWPRPSLLRRTNKPSHALQTELLGFQDSSDGVPYRLFRYIL
jgi:hypothetical protein